MSRILTEGWSQTKEALMDGLAPSKQRVMSAVLENTRKNLLESATSGATSSGDVATLNKVILPIIRRVVPTVIANELMGVQPMQGPVAQIHTLRVRYGETVGSSPIAGQEALSPFYIAAGYSGDATNGTANSTAAMEGVAGRKLNIQLLKQTVEAKTRALSARWTIEAAQDFNAMHGVDLEAEIMGALANQIILEVDQEMIGKLTALAGTPTLTWDQANVTGTPTYVGDKHASIALLINKAANDISSRTQRGAGNWCVVSNNVLTLLQSATTSSFARTTEGPFEAPTNTKLVGTLNNSMKVYVNQYSANDNILVGYKGSETDAAAFYCPYIPLQASNILQDPTTFEPVVQFKTRYGYAELDNTASSFGNSPDYLEAISVNSGTITYI